MELGNKQAPRPTAVWRPEGPFPHTGPLYGIICIATALTVSQEAAEKETAVPEQGDYGFNIWTHPYWAIPQDKSNDDVIDSTGI